MFKKECLQTVGHEILLYFGFKSNPFYTAPCAITKSVKIK